MCNVNSGTTIRDVEEMIQSALENVSNSPEAQIFLFFDEMNTADPSVIGKLNLAFYNNKIVILKMIFFLFIL